MTVSPLWANFTFSTLAPIYATEELGFGADGYGAFLGASGAGALTAALVVTAVALLWLVHPLQTESVTYVIQRAESLMGLFYLLTLVTSPDLPYEFRRRSFSMMEWLGRYSMTDVMVLALLIFYVNSSGYTEADVQPGVYFFAASVIMTMLAYGWANSVAGVKRAKKGG